MNVNLMEKVKNAKTLPSLPSVAIEVLKLTRRDDVSVDALAQVLQYDPALCGRLLKVVNSAMFGMPREVGTVKQAMVILGLRTVKVMALSFSVVDSLRMGAGSEFDIERYWRRSLSSAVAARLIGKAVAPRVAEEAFVAGLLSDIGLFASWCCAADEYLPAVRMQTQTGRPMHMVEQELLGTTHAAIGRELLKTWNLPDPVCSAVAAHHGEGADGECDGSGNMTSVVRAAARVAELFCGDVTSDCLEQVRQDCMAWTGIAEPQLEDVLKNLNKHVKETAKLLSLKIGDTMSYADIRTEAAEQLAQLSMMAEVDRASATRKADEATQTVGRLEQEKKSILEEASTDALTRIANRAAFDRKLSQELANLPGGSTPLGLILLDVDHFKKFNDTHGHQAGDEVLRSVGECLREVAGSAGLVARYGGEEFAVIASQSAAQLRDLAEQIRKAIEGRTIQYDGKPLKVTASLGAVCARPGNGAAGTTAPAAALAPMAKQLIEAADQRLYQAKRDGRNRVVAG